MENELTSQQIEAEGWTYLRNHNKTAIYEKGLYELRYHTLTKEASFSRTDIASFRDYGPNTNVSGSCPDLKTFRYICKMIGV